MNNASHEELRAANEDAASFYRRQLLSASASGPREYLTGRGFEALLDETPWAVGYAPRGWTGTYEHLAALGYSDDTLLAAGLVSRTRRGSLIDRFRDRITFGIRSVSGEMVGFTARRGPGAPADCPKYLNTATTPIYTKGEHLFGWAESASSAQGASTIVLTEGPLDAIAVSLGHIGRAKPLRAVAICGSALTPTQAATVARDARDVIMVFDTDPPGRNATANAYQMFAGYDLAISLPSGRLAGDPAETLAVHGSTGVREAITPRLPAILAIIDDCIDSWPGGKGAESDLCCLRHTVHAIGGLQSRDAAAAARRLAARLHLEPAVITRELTRAATARASPPRRRTTQSLSGEKQCRR